MGTPHGSAHLISGPPGRQPRQDPVGARAVRSCTTPGDQWSAWLTGGEARRRTAGQRASGRRFPGVAERVPRGRPPRQARRNYAHGTDDREELLQEIVYQLWRGVSVATRREAAPITCGSTGSPLQHRGSRRFEGGRAGRRRTSRSTPLASRRRPAAGSDSGRVELLYRAMRRLGEVERGLGSCSYLRRPELPGRSATRAGHLGDERRRAAEPHAGRKLQELVKGREVARWTSKSIERCWRGQADVLPPRLEEGTVRQMIETRTADLAAGGARRPLRREAGYRPCRWSPMTGLLAGFSLVTA